MTAGFDQTGIISYAAKFASRRFTGHSARQPKARRSLAIAVHYQMDFAQRK